jgi:hypothetical protein
MSVWKLLGEDPARPDTFLHRRIGQEVGVHEHAPPTQNSVAINTARVAKGQTYRSNQTQAMRASGVVSASCSLAKTLLTRHPMKMLVNKAPMDIMILEHI